MAETYLGGAFDIHGGGLDLIFPHHENERAQSVGAGDAFANFWLHNGLLTLSGEKMSKSLGNTLLVRELAERVRPVALRYYLLAPHYRSAQEYSDELLVEAEAAYGRLEGFVLRAAELVGPDAGRPSLCADFVEAMDDDLSTPRALAALHDVVRGGNTALSTGDKPAVAGALGATRAMLDVLGLDPLSAPWSGAVSSDLRPTVDALVGVVVEERAQARQRRDFAAADRIRDKLTHAGVLIEDTAAGPRWTIMEKH